MLFSNFYFVVQGVRDRDRGAVCPRMAIAAGMLFVMALMVLMLDAQKDLPVGMGGVFCSWDLMIGRYEGICGAVLTSW